MKTILLTGGTGYIGSHTASVLLEKGYNVIIIDNLYNSGKSVIQAISKITGKETIFYEGDIRDRKILEKIFLENNIDTVIHFAGLKAVGESCEKPFLYYENNIVGSLHLFEVMEEFGVKNIIFSSTGTVYSEFDSCPFTEGTTTGNTTNPYSTTKFIIENLLRDLSKYKDFNVINLRYFNPIGAHKSGLIGENPNDIPNNLLPYVMKVAVGKLDHLSIFGTDYPTKDGTGERDYIHVIDLAEAHYKALKYLENTDGYIYENINIGTGKATSVFEVVKLTEEVIGNTLPLKFAGRRYGDLPVTYCLPQKAEKLLNWKAKLTVKEAICDQYNFVKRTSVNGRNHDVAITPENDTLYIYKLQYKQIVDLTIGELEKLKVTI